MPTTMEEWALKNRLIDKDEIISGLTNIMQKVTRASEALCRRLMSIYEPYFGEEVYHYEKASFPKQKTFEEAEEFSMVMVQLRCKAIRTFLPVAVYDNIYRLPNQFFEKIADYIECNPLEPAR
uniref:Uncharacterized protein n=1 Tax=Cacopsylla melanoneura TaxID=428564 RepID=A0A8D8TG38_9HEMI